MIKYIIKKIIGLIIILLGVSILSFLFSNFSPVDPAEAYANRIITHPTQKQIIEIRNQLGLDKPILVQYGKWISKVVRGNFGVSLLTGKKVSSELPKEFLATFSISGLATIFTFIIMVPVSILSALKKGGIFDKITNIVTILGISFPNFWIGFMLLILLAITIPIFKIVDYGNFKSLILPAVSLSIPISGVSIRLFRSELISSYNQDFVTYARARGLSERKISGMVMKNALPPIVTLLFQNVGYCIAGSAVVESVFSWPGIGTHLIRAILGRDLPTINACVLIIAVIFVLLNFIADIINHCIDPLWDTQKGGKYD